VDVVVRHDVEGREAVARVGRGAAAADRVGAAAGGVVLHHGEFHPSRKIARQLIANNALTKFSPFFH
jgi:hypothetical protein